MKKNIIIKNITKNYSLPIYVLEDIDFFILGPQEEKYIKDIEEWVKFEKSIKTCEKNGLLEIKYETKFTRFEIMDI